MRRPGPPDFISTTPARADPDDDVTTRQLWDYTAGLAGGIPGHGQG
jgi:CubicO group peptidase (beta-lactamase class C family)